MPQVLIEEQGCRGCTMCFDICPVDVFEYDEGKHLATVGRQDDCIGCLSCFYVCPSQCVVVNEIDLIPPFHRIEENVELVERFLQQKTATTTITEQACEGAFKDVCVRLNAMVGALTETMGRGQKAVGRKAGAVAAFHFPEMYEGKDLNEILERMQNRFKHSFTFDYKIDGGNVEMDFHPCGLYQVVTELGETVGESTLCQLFHEYWAGILGAFTGDRYVAEVPSCGESCKMNLTSNK